VPSFGKPAKVPKAGVASATIGGSSADTPPEIAMASIGKSAHLYKPAPALEVERKQAEAAIDPTEDTVKIVTGFECSTPLEIEKISPTHFAVKITTDSTLRNWFMFRVEGAKGKTVRIDIKDAPLNKWWSLNPVWSGLASIDDPATFHKVTSDKKYPAMQAYNGPQLPDTSAQNWHYISDVWSTDQQPDKTGTYCFVRTYDTDGEYLAMRPPYTPKYNEAYLKSLEGRPGVKVIEVGKSKQGRPLHIVQIGEGDPKSVPCVVMYAREHASEQDTSWVVQGAIDFVVSDTIESRRMREKFTFLAIPLLDPDGAAAAQYESITQRFLYDGDEGPEARCYAGFLAQWVDSGRRLDLVINLHNVESSEQCHLSCPRMEPGTGRLVQCEAFHALVIAAGQRAELNVSPKPWGYGYASFRLGGYMSKFYGTLHMPYEINSQDKARHLRLNGLSHIGTLLIEATTAFFASPEATKLEESIDAVQNARALRMQMWAKELKGMDNALQIEWISFWKDAHSRDTKGGVGAGQPRIEAQGQARKE
jgi:hypothetical protein